MLAHLKVFTSDVAMAGGLLMMALVMIALAEKVRVWWHHGEPPEPEDDDHPGAWTS